MERWRETGLPLVGDNCLLENDLCRVIISDMVGVCVCGRLLWSNQKCCSNGGTIKKMKKTVIWVDVTAMDSYYMVLLYCRIVSMKGSGRW